MPFLAFFLSPIGRLIGVGAIAAIVGASGAAWATHHWDGLAYERLKNSQQAAVIVAQQQAIALRAAQDKKSHDVDVANATAQQKIVTRTVEIVRKVPVYVSPETDKHFPLPCGFVRLHDAAALGTEPDAIPNPAGKSDDSACEVTASQAASIIAENYGTANATAQRLKSLEDWVEAMEATNTAHHP